MILQNAIYVCSILTTMKMIARLGALAGLTLATGAGEGPGPVFQQAYVKSSNAGLNDQFAWSGGGIALAGDTLVAGAPGEDSSAKGVDGDQGDGLDPTPRNPSDGFDAGAAYVFLRYGSGWSQQAYLKSTDTASNDAFGRAVAVSEDTVVVGAVGEDGKQDGVPYEGAAYVFVREGNTWRQQARLNVPGDSENKGFGVAVAICGDIVVVGASNERAAPTAEGEKPGSVEKLMAGAAYVFVREGGEWRRQARLGASNARYKLHFGTSVAISGNTIIVGAIGDNSAAGGVNGDQTDDSALGAGAAYVFVRDGTKWSQQAYLKAPKPGKFDEFGTAVAIAGETAVVGAVAAKAAKAANGRKSDGQRDKDNGPGAAFVFMREGNVWSEQASLTPPQFEGGEEYGCSVAISGDHLVVGAKRTRDRSTKRRDHPGAAYVFTRKDATWDQGAPLRAPHVKHGDQFGGSVAISGSTVVVGAVGDDSYARGVNLDRDEKDEGNQNSGAAYVFEMTGTGKARTTPAGAGDGQGTIEERLWGYWATDWDAMAESWQPAVKGWAEMSAAGRGLAAAEKKVVEELKEVYGAMTVEIKKGELTLYQDPGRPDRMTYVPAASDPATRALELKTSKPGGAAGTWRAVLNGDRLTLMESGDEGSPLPLVLNRIDAAAFEKRNKSAEEHFKDRKAKLQGAEEAMKEEPAESTEGRKESGESPD
jgi:hypothetical protein